MSPPNHRQPGRPRRKRSGGCKSTPGRVSIPTVDHQGLAVFQLNVEGLTNAKLEIIRHLADSHKVAAVLLQETHCMAEDTLKLPGFHLAGSILSRHHGIATFVRSDLGWTATGQSPPNASVEWLSTRIQATSVVNVYKPPPSTLTVSALPLVQAPAIYAGDFNCQHTDWGYFHTTPDGETLCEWASNANAQLLFDPKEPQVSTLQDGTPSPTQTSHLLYATTVTQFQRDRLSIGSPGHTTGRLSSKPPHWCSREKVNLPVGGTCGRPTGRHSLREREHQPASRTQTSLMWTQHMQPSAKCF